MNDVEPKLSKEAVDRVLDVLAPKHEWSNGERIPIFVWENETTPTEEEMLDLAIELVIAVADRKSDD